MNYVEEYKNLLQQYKMLEGRLEEKKDAYNRLTQIVENEEQEITLCNDALDILEATSQAYQKQVFEKMDMLVTEALRVICEDDSLSVTTEIEYKRGAPEAVTKYHDGVSPAGGELTFTHGGGIVDIVSCANRLIVAELTNTPGFISYDEPARMLHSQSTRHEVNFIKFLHEFSHRRNRQIIIITHSEHLADIADIGYRVEQEAKRSVAKRLGD